MLFEDQNAKPTNSQLNELPLTFLGRGEVRGFKFTRLLQNDRGYLYQVEQSEGLIHLEVFMRVENKRFNCISYPGSQSFGISAWSCKNLEDAKKRFDALIQEEMEVEVLEHGSQLVLNFNST